MKYPVFRRALYTSIVAAAFAGAATLAPTKQQIIPAAQAASSLGDLSSFRSIVTDTKTLVDKDDLAGAKARIKDLETSWDEAEAGLKPRAPTEWHKVDKAIDRALADLRASSPQQAACEQSLSDLLKIMDEASRQA